MLAIITLGLAVELELGSLNELLVEGVLDLAWTVCCAPFSLSAREMYVGWSASIALRMAGSRFVLAGTCLLPPTVSCGTIGGKERRFMASDDCDFCLCTALTAGGTKESEGLRSLRTSRDELLMVDMLGCRLKSPICAR